MGKKSKGVSFKVERMKDVAAVRGYALQFAQPLHPRLIRAMNRYVMTPTLVTLDSFRLETFLWLCSWSLTGHPIHDKLMVTIMIGAQDSLLKEYGIRR